MFTKLQNLLNLAKAKLANLKEDSKKDLATLWAQDKGYIIAFGALILFLKYRDLIISILVNSGKREVASAQKQSDALQAQENQANQQANELVKDANKLASQDTTETDVEWYKK